MLADYEVREYPLGKFGQIYAYCDTTVVPLQIEHIHARAAGGSNHVSNLTLAYRLCTSNKAAQNIRGFLANTPARLTRILQ
ncbi:HNH endonuclease [Janthinobacterium lividum]|jgi:hypothetical protein|uniref:HNH endonuclease n=1 Tax=Janthinobacterium lividum TaxID=29581 RepID=UPI000873A324|nr:hypothetical protein JANLI_06720 [Janthinobacterium lividum]STS85977.1 Uncharacterised protein [Janthinobacterium lividum]